MTTTDEARVTDEELLANTPERCNLSPCNGGPCQSEPDVDAVVDELSSRLAAREREIAALIKWADDNGMAKMAKAIASNSNKVIP